MKEFCKILEKSEGYKKLLACVEAGPGVRLAAGLSNIHKAHYIYSLTARTGKSAHIVAPNEPTAIRLCEDINAFFGEETALFFPSRELVFRDVEGASHEYEHTRLTVLSRILLGSCKMVISSAESSLQYTIPPAILREHSKTLTPGDKLSEQSLVSLLLRSGYVRSDQVEGIAQFAVRGGIIDFFPPGTDLPRRVELWGDEIDTISTFDPATQRRVDLLDATLLSPAREALITKHEILIKQLENTLPDLKGKYGILAKEHIAKDISKLLEHHSLTNADKYLPLLYKTPATLFDYFDTESLLFVCEPISIKESLKNSAWQTGEDLKIFLAQGVLFKGCDTFTLDFVDLTQKIAASNAVLMDTFTRSIPDLPLDILVETNPIALSVWSGEYSFLKEDILSYIDRGFAVAVFAGTDRALSALESDLNRDDIPAKKSEDISSLSKGGVYLLPGTLSSGMEYPDISFAVITHTKVSGQKAKKRKRSKDEKRIKTLSDLVVGDYIVHTGHGIGVFEGIVKRDIHGIIKDYIKIRYAGTDMLFVPVTQLDLVSKYIGAAEGAKVRLNKLNSVEWQKTRLRVKSAVKDMAKELIVLYAQRQNAKGFAFSPDSEWQKEFEERFPYQETDDQLRCIEEIKADMQKEVPMERLLCGDVGFGKTEVALRAAFKCVLDSKQCAVLVPTTILAWQHYQTFTQRLEGYPVTIELLSRFKTPKEQADIIKRLKNGTVDIVIGTHRIVQKDIAFKDLGLCIVDEEQRFGVAHKERFKEMRANIDVLTLSATPIPRTLNMAMSGIRDMSIIEDPPQDRQPVQTYVLEHDLGIITQAIGREIRRGGQVFYIHNRIDSIESCAAKLLEALPDARIVTAHGKVGEDKLSEVWKKLVDHEIDILVCTTIIETGVDVPNCNTLIIEDADKMGLAQLYQIRGRVGRSSRRAYAYLTFKPQKSLSDIAVKRLSAIREFTTFGSGFRIAMRDLELRGAGNVLGAQQHGHMEAVGYDLYLRLLSEAVSEEQGNHSVLPTECMIDLRLSAHIPEKYIENLSQRIDIYKKIAAIQNNEDSLDVIDELIDRFGDPPDAVKGLVDVALVRNTASGLRIKEISQKDDKILLYPEELDMSIAASLATEMRGRVLLSAGIKPYISVKVLKNTDPIDTIRETLRLMAAAKS